MSEKQGTSEGVYGDALQDPRARVKAGWPPSHSPAVEPHTHRSHAWDAVPSRACRSERGHWKSTRKGNSLVAYSTHAGICAGAVG